MMNTRTAAYGMYSRDVALPDVVCALNRAGFDKENICMVLSPAHPDAAIFQDSQDSTSGMTGHECSPTARMIRWFSEFGAVVIPTIGVFIRSQDFFSALLANPSPSALSRGSRTLMDLGFSQDDAKRLGMRLCDVSALVYVSCPEGTKAIGAIELLRRTGAQEASSLGAMTAAAAA
jgi:hypothetical protein